MPASPAARRPAATERSRPALRLTLLGRFELTVDGGPCRLGRGPSRLVALLALYPGGLSRSAVSARLAPHLEPESRASSLRKQLARLRARAPADLVEEQDRTLRLSPRVAVDVPEAVALASRIARRETVTPGTDVGGRLSLELLPGWDDDWLIPVRVGLSDRFLNALEVHARELEDRGDRDGALAAVQHMLQADALWEGAVGVQLEIYRAQWNRAKVERTFLAFRRQLRGELGTEPSPELRDLVVRLLDGRSP